MREAFRCMEPSRLEIQNMKTIYTRADDASVADSEMDTELHALFLTELADIYDAENRLLKALPKMAEAAHCDDLRAAFESHIEETKGHAARLEQIAASLGEELEKHTCKAMKGLIAEGEDLMDELKDSSALDAGLIAAAQKVEHYEIATYGTLCAWAEEMGHEHELELLHASLEEEKSADKKLTELAYGGENSEAEE
jgi:ferritin-like metal-binding protein YciE